MIGLTTFLPVYVQGVMRQSALVAGFSAVGHGAWLADRSDACDAASWLRSASAACS